VNDLHSSEHLAASDEPSTDRHGDETALLAGLRAGDDHAFETLVRSFVGSPDRGSQVRLADLLAFVEQGSGLFTLKPFPESFLVAEHLATGLVEREVDAVSLGEKERAELKSLTLRLLV